MSGAAAFRQPISDTPGLAARSIAAKLLGAVIETGTSLDGLTDAENGHPQYRALDGRDRALVRAILTTVLRFRNTIAALISRRLERPLPPKATALGHILHVAAAQILFLDVPDSAAVDVAVTQAKADPRTVRFSGLVNGLLRSLSREKERELPDALAATIDAPDWLARRLKQTYGDAIACRILAMQRSETPTDFTVRSDPARWAELLGGIVLPTGSVRVPRLDRAVPELPGYAEGAWWVQDAAAALPAQLFSDVTGLRVADLCAAPGGKTAQLCAAGAIVTAIDASKSRLKRLQANLDRLGLQAELVHADLRSFRPDQPFDAALLDAPCSSTGTIRRHPDVAWTKRLADVEKLAAVQRELLEATAPLVRPGGRIVFSNCSLDPLEGETLADAFPAGRGDVAPDPIASGEVAALDAFISAAGHLRTTPADLDLGEAQLSGMDGFFAARFRRI